MGFKGLKPKAKFLMLLYSEDDLQGLGFPVGAPKPSFLKSHDDDDDDDEDGGDDVMGDWGLNGLKPKAKFLMPLYSEQDLQGLGFSVGAPKPSFSTAMMMIMMV